MPRTRLFGVLLVAGTAACAKEAQLVNVAGSCGTAFTGQICTWAHTKGDSLIDAGATIPLSAIDSAPMPAANAPMDWPPKPDAMLDMPASVVAKTGLTKLTFYWEPTGHPPMTFMTPHFDFHFYTNAVADIAAITCADSTKPAALPTGYTLPDEDIPPPMVKAMGTSKLIGTCVPMMGMHAMPSGDMSSTSTFRGSMLVGYYQGKPIFIEPMISRAMLDEKKSFYLAIPDVPGLTSTHPTTFHATFDPATSSYNFAYSDFVQGK
jgi:hypothetical protein